MTDNLVIIPTYNERENIIKIIEAVFSLELAFHVLVVDDGSPDGTATLVKELKRDKYPDSLFILERHYEYFFEMDADFSHNPKDLLRLHRACSEQGGDVAVGSRYIKGGKLENWPASRIMLSFGASLYVRLFTWMPVNDPTAGFVAYRREVLKTIDFQKIRFIGYAFQIEMKFAAHQLGFKIKEVPITFTDRIEGTSKMSKGIVKEAVLGVLQMRFNSLFSSYSGAD